MHFCGWLESRCLSGREPDVPGGRCGDAKIDRISNPEFVAAENEGFLSLLSSLTLTAGKGGTNVRKWIKVVWTLTSMERIKWQVKPNAAFKAAFN
jgi:hypothetical protein